MMSGEGNGLLCSLPQHIVVQLFRMDWKEKPDNAFLLYKLMPSGMVRGKWTKL